MLLIKKDISIRIYEENLKRIKKWITIDVSFNKKNGKK
jgi:hypothetical protein